MQHMLTLKAMHAAVANVKKHKSDNNSNMADRNRNGGRGYQF